MELLNFIIRGMIHENVEKPNLSWIILERAATNVIFDVFGW